MRNMLSDRARKRWELEAAKTTALESASPYRGHDMVEAISFDAHGSMVAGTLTSRLFMKEPGRVGDSPLPGSDFYADSAIGGAAATRLGEGIMKECLSYRIVALTGSGLSPQEACDSAVYEFDDRLRNRYGKVCEISKVALNKRGEGGGRRHQRGIHLLRSQGARADMHTHGQSGRQRRNTNRASDRVMAARI